MDLKSPNPNPHPRFYKKSQAYKGSVDEDPTKPEHTREGKEANLHHHIMHIQQIMDESSKTKDDLAEKLLHHIEARRAKKNRFIKKMFCEAPASL